MPIGPKVKRFAKADCVLQLAEEMQATRSGISLSDIEQRFAVSHRTAQRMRDAVARLHPEIERSEEHTSEPQSLMRISYAVFCLNKQKAPTHIYTEQTHRPETT